MKHPPAQSTAVAVSSLLRGRHPALLRDLRTVLIKQRVELLELEGTKDIWTRDYMPIQRHDGKVVSFTYSPDYLRKSYRHPITNWKKVTPLPKGLEVVDSGLILDGGNVVLQDRVAIFTNKLSPENAHLNRGQIETRLRESFELEKLIFIPQEQGDIWGHSDGMVSWAGPDRLLMNDWRKIDLQFHRELKGILTKAGLEVAEIPYAPDLRPREIPSAQGTYINMLVLPEIVLVPVYGIPTDEKALARIEIEFPDRQVVPISASTLAHEGGSIHCITVEYGSGQEQKSRTVEAGGGEPAPGKTIRQTVRLAKPLVKSKISRLR